MKKFNNLFSLMFDVSDCDREDIVTVTGLFVTETLNEAELFGFNISVSKAPIENHLVFSDGSSRIIVVKNSRGEIVTAVSISSDMFEELKTSIQEQIPIVEKAIANEEALIASCHSKEYGTKPECMVCVLRSSCALLYNADNKKTVVDSSIDIKGASLNNWKAFNKERHEYNGELITVDGTKYHIYLAFKQEPLGKLSLDSLHAYMVFKVSDSGELLTDDDYAVANWDKINMVQYAFLGF